MIFVNILLSALIISLGTYLAKEYPATAGYVVGAIPLSTALTLAFTQLEYHDTQKTLLIARSVFVAMCLSVSFFIPYFIASKIRMNFWITYALSIVLVVAMFPIHQRIMSAITKN